MGERAVTNGVSLYGTLSASNVLCCSAVLNGLVTLRAVETSAWFEWGSTTNFGNTTPVQALGTGLLPLLVTNHLSGLQPLTGYFFRLVSSNNLIVTFGETSGFTTELPSPTGIALSPINLACTSATLLGALPIGGAPANYFVEWGATENYGNDAQLIYLNAALRFDGTNDCVLTPPTQFPDITNNFTMELWVNPTADRAETVESSLGFAGIGGQRYAIFPAYVASSPATPRAGVGLSVGLNGLSVAEHSGSHLPTVLVLSNKLAGWFHVALSYSNGLPRLYLNGTLARTGPVSSRTVHPSAYFGGTTDSGWSYGPYAGAIHDVRIWNVPLDANTIRTWMNSTITSQHPAFANLQGYWLLNEGHGLAVVDLSPRGNSGQLVNGPIWTPGLSSDAFLFSTTLVGLTPGAEYHFRNVATNGGGTACGADQTFTSLPRPTVVGVSVQTIPASPGTMLQFSGSPELPYVLETSTNLVNWLELTNLVAGADGLFQYLDSAATNFPTRFYRLRVP